ncbi:MAG: rhomboid family intramembrane serine protease [Candidatus Limnocylindria bacterium]
MSDEPRLRLAEGRRLLDSGEPSSALAILAPLTGHPDPELAGEAWLLTGTARYREDDEPGALIAWQNAAQAGGSSAWLGWRSVAEQHVRNGELDDAIVAYREADRRAPPGERGAIANRIAWLLKETGHDFAARRQFNRARGAYGSYTGFVTYALIGACVAVFLLDGALGGAQGLSVAFIGGGGPLLEAGLINGGLVAGGEWWRILTSAFFHLGILHLGMNMYVLYLYGPIVEQMYGHIEYLAIYLLCAAGGSVLTILLLPEQFAAGASGAIFGLIGMLFVVARRHHAVLGRQARTVLAGIGTYLVVLLIFTFAVPGISWTGHVGGLAVGAAIGFLLPPTQVPTLSGLWRAPSGERLQTPMPAAVRLAVYAAVLALLVGGSWFAVVRLVA